MVILIDHPDVTTWREQVALIAAIDPVKPEALTHETWPPDYPGVYAWRYKTLQALRDDPAMLAAAKQYYSTRPNEFIMHWMDTYDPRRVVDKWIPFVFFKRQNEYIIFIHELRLTGESGLNEKCRDAGATWGGCAYSIWSWLFIPSDAIGWGSRKELLVDKIGDPDSIFEKMRLLIKRLPDVFLPIGFVAKEHATYMKIINPENNSIISGEAGDNIGRGGRKSIFFLDEAAHIERPEKVEAALGDNTRVRVDISSVNGFGNPFHRRREAGVIWYPDAKLEPHYTRVFITDWRDHPDKTQEWYDQRKAKYEREGLLHIFAQEVDRNYSAAISNTVIPYEYVVACVDAHKRIPVLMGDLPDKHFGGLDVADEGIDRNALAIRQWVVLRSVEEWGERDPGVTTRRAIAGVRTFKDIEVMYDAIGLGATVKAEYNRLTIDEKMVLPKFVAWNAGAKVLEPYNHIIPTDKDSLSNEDYFGNLKAQAWLSLYSRCYKTYCCIVALNKGEPLPNYTGDELISFDSTMPLLQQLLKELAQPTKGQGSRLRMIVNKQPDGMKSPNLADAVVMAYFPIPHDYSTVHSGSYG